MLDVLEMMRCMLLCLLEVPEVMRCVLLCMLKAVEGELWLLEMLDAMRYVLLRNIPSRN